MDNEQIIAWVKRDDSGDDVVIGVVNLDPHWMQSGFVHVDLTDVGIGQGETFGVHDVLTKKSYLWQAGRNFVSLDPARVPAHVLVLERP